MRTQLIDEDEPLNLIAKSYDEMLRTEQNKAMARQVKHEIN